ncbi:MAG TPA: Mpo1-like protein [Polyangiaceae bacterium]|jgi:hypothetical protein|nr:Mpo1-like protein [Polyangiaceae bacterium]
MQSGDVEYLCARDASFRPAESATPEASDVMPALAMLARVRARRSRARYRTFGAFFSAYLRAHANPKTASFHVIGAALGVLSFVALLSCGMVFFAVFAVVPAQLFAAIGHWFTGEHDDVSPHRPDWAIVANLGLLWLAVTGNLERAVRDATTEQRAAQT